MRINQNIAAFNAYRNLNNTQNSLSSSLEKLSSGFRINRAADDASGLVNSENLRSQIGGLKVATRNAQDAISLVQTAEGAQTEVHSILQRMRDLAVQSGNLGTNDASALKANQDEMNELVSELDRISEQTQFGTLEIFNEFADYEAASSASYAFGDLTLGDWSGTDAEETVTINGVELEATGNYSSGEGTVADLATELNEAIAALEGDDSAALEGVSFSVNDQDQLVVSTAETGDDASLTVEAAAASAFGDTEIAATGDDALSGADASGGAVFQVGANENQTVRVGITGVDAGTLNVTGLNIGEGADEASIALAIERIDQAISDVSENRAELGAFQNRMESTVRNIGVATENLSAAESRIRDTDMAQEMTEFTRNQILSQAGTAMLAQANTVPQSVLSLLG